MTEGQDPDDGDGGGADDGAGRAATPSGRVTLDFTGPPLSLPDDSDHETSDAGVATHDRLQSAAHTPG